MDLTAELFENTREKHFPSFLSLPFKRFHKTVMKNGY